MRWTSYLSDKAILNEAFEDISSRIRADWPDAKPDLVLVFVSSYSLGETKDVGRRLQDSLQAGCLIGCTAGGVVGEAKEVERRPALSVTLAQMPGVQIHGFHMKNEELPEVYASPAKWEERLGIPLDAKPHFILLPDPYSFDSDRLIRGLDQSYPESKKIGGLASGGGAGAENCLFLGDRSFSEGAVGIGLSGNCEIDTIVAQGCRPVGHPMFITRCQDNLLQELDGKTAGQTLKQLYTDLSPRDQELFRNSLFLGIVMKDSQKEYKQGDFLIRNILGLSQESDALAIGSLLHVNQVVQFHLRDAQTSTEDLHHMLVRNKTEALTTPKAGGALLFSCMGRGAHLFGEPGHDSKIFRSFLGDISLSGFFCNGEIGPVHGKTFLHGYTSSFGIFREKN